MPDNIRVLIRSDQKYYITLPDNIGEPVPEVPNVPLVPKAPIKKTHMGLPNNIGDYDPRVNFVETKNPRRMAKGFMLYKSLLSLTLLQVTDFCK